MAPFKNSGGCLRMKKAKKADRCDKHTSGYFIKCNQDISSVSKQVMQSKGTM